MEKGGRKEAAVLLTVYSHIKCVCLFVYVTLFPLGVQAISLREANTENLHLHLAIQLKSIFSDLKMDGASAGISMYRTVLPFR